MLSDNSQTTLVGTMTNNGNILFQGLGNNTYLFLSGNVTLAGNGTITLDNTGLDHIYALSFGDTLTIGANQTIQGSGDLGGGQTNIVNNGTLIANQSTPLTLDPGGGAVTNNGTIESVSSGALQFNGTVNSRGTVDVGSGTLTVTGNYTQTAGSFLVAGGTVQSSNDLNFQGGLVDAHGTINAAIMNNAMLRPALGGSGLNVTGNVSLLAASNLVFQLGGLTQGNQYGFLNVNGSVGLGGNLVVSFVNGFVAQNNDNFTVLSSTAPLTGIFANVASGGRLTTTDNSGSFLVIYNGSTVVLSDFVAGPRLPATFNGTANGAVVADDGQPIALNTNHARAINLDMELANERPAAPRGIRAAVSGGIPNRSSALPRPPRTADAKHTAGERKSPDRCHPSSRLHPTPRVAGRDGGHEDPRKCHRQRHARSKINQSRWSRTRNTERFPEHTRQWKRESWR